MLTAMANVSTVTAVWNGFPGAPGYTLFRFAELDTGAKLNAAGAAIRTFFLALTTYMAPTPSQWTVQVTPLVQHHDIATGKLQGESTMGTVPTVNNGTGPAGTVFAGGSGAVIHWTTGATHDGRKIRGRTFLVPLLSNAYSTDGTITPALQTALQNAGNALIADSTTEFGVYSRIWDKKPGDPPVDVPPKQTSGLFTPATGCLVPDRSAQLRTRRT
jgi:hypothetical protein